MKYYAVTAVATFLLLSLTSCGSSDRKEYIPTIPDTLRALDTRVIDTNFSYYGAGDLNNDGIDSEGNLMTGRISNSGSQNDVYLEGYSNSLVDKRVVLINFRYKRGYYDLLEQSRSSYLDSNGNTIALEVEMTEALGMDVDRPFLEPSTTISTTMLCWSALPDKIPSSVTAGQSGSLTTLECDDGSFIERQWYTQVTPDLENEITLIDKHVSSMGGVISWTEQILELNSSLGYVDDIRIRVSHSGAIYSIWSEGITEYLKLDI